MKNLLDQIQKVRSGNVTTIPFIHPTLNKYIFLGKRLYHLIGGAGGSGKSAWIDQNYAINPILWMNRYGKDEDIKIKVVLRSLERSKELRKAKWVCLRLYLTKGILMDTASMLGWGETKSRITDDLYEDIKEAYEWVTSLEEHIEIIDGAETPTGIYKHLRQEALNKGTLYQYANEEGKEKLYMYREEKRKVVPPEACPEATPYQPVYIPDDPNEVTIFIIDHLQSLKNERGYNNKQNLDKMSEYAQILRDRFGFSPVIVNQLNRNVGDTFRRVKTDLLPEEGDFSGSSRMFYDCDMAAILFNPYKYNLNTMSGWNIKKCIHEGINRFRSLHLLKNTYGADNQIFGYQFIGENGIFREMTHPEIITDKHYEGIKNPEANQRITKHTI